MPMPDAPAITIPRLPGERAERHEARVAYLTAGADRSLRGVAQKLNKSLTLIGRWSVSDGWDEQARAYDSTLANLAARAAAERYLADLAAHGERSRKTAGDLYAVASGLLGQCARAVRGERIEGKDGKIYTIPAMELTPSTLATAMRGLVAALDLEAHALGVDKLLGSLTTEGDADA